MRNIKRRIGEEEEADVRDKRRSISIGADDNY